MPYSGGGRLWKKKATSAAAILSLGLGIGACTSAFRLIDALLLRPLPVASPERLYSVVFESPGAMDRVMSTYDSCSYPMFQRMRAAIKEEGESIAVSMYSGYVDLTYGADEDMEKADVQYVSGWMFGTFGLRPALGRLLTEDDDLKPGGHPYAVLSYDYWSRRFGRDQSVIGRTFRMGNDVFEIVGVAEEKFTGTETGWVTDVFIPMAMKNARTLASLNNFWLRTLVQLKPGVAAGPIREKLRATFHALQEERAASFPNLTKRDRERFFQETLLFESAAAGRSNMQRDYRQALATLGLLVALVLLIACANVANLMTAQAAARAREMALRVSIGAGRWRLVQLVMIESAWLAFLAAGVGGLFAWWSAPVVVGMINPPTYAARLVIPADWRVMGFGLALACGVTFLFGLTPALRASTVKPVSALRGGEDPHSRRRLMHGLIAAQVAFCFLVHFVAGLFVVTFERLSNQPTGFSAERILNLETVTARPQPPAYWDQVADDLRTVPGVEKVALIGWPLMSGESAVGNISVNGAAPSDVFSDFVSISPGWREVMSVPLLGGRDFRAGDVNPAVAIVNQAFAKQYFNGEDPVGKWFQRVEPAGGGARFEIVGMVHDARSRDNLRLTIRPTVYIPFQSVDATGAFLPKGRGTFVVRTASANPLALASTLRREVPHARVGVPREQYPYAGGAEPVGADPRAAAGDTGALLLGGGAAAGGDRIVRRAGLRRAAAAARDRDSHGDWRAGGRHRAAGDGGHLRDGAGGGGGGPGAGHGVGAIYRNAAVRSEGDRGWNAGASFGHDSGGGSGGGAAGGGARGAHRPGKYVEDGLICHGGHESRTFFAGTD